MTRSAATDLAQRYDAAAAGWGDKMRALGYFDAYRAFLAAHPGRTQAQVLDIGAGTAAFSEAWVVTHGARSVTLLDPSAQMLDHGAARLAAHGVPVTRVQATLDAAPSTPAYDTVLAAHVLEHVADPLAMLRDIRARTLPDGRLWLVVSKPHWCNAIVWLQWRHRSYRPPQVHALLAAAGWRATAPDFAFAGGPPSRTSRGYLAMPA